MTPESPNFADTILSRVKDIFPETGKVDLSQVVPYSASGLHYLFYPDDTVIVVHQRYNAIPRETCFVEYWIRSSNVPVSSCLQAHFDDPRDNSTRIYNDM